MRLSRSICNGGGYDVRLLQREEDIHGILAAPPCTCFASSGAWVKRSNEDMIQALSVVDACIRIAWACKPKWWVLENPVGTLARYLGAPGMYFNPCDYGDPYTKKTCLWGDFTPPLPLLVGEARNVKPSLGNAPIMKLGGKSMKTKNARSKTPAGFARAFFEVNP